MSVSPENRAPMIAKQERIISNLTRMVHPQEFRSKIAKDMVRLYAKKYALLAAIEDTETKVTEGLEEQLSRQTTKINQFVGDTEGYDRITARGVEMQVRELEKTFAEGATVSPTAATAMALQTIAEKEQPPRRIPTVFDANPNYKRGS